MTKIDKEKAIEILLAGYPDPKPALKFSTPYELLIAVVLSAQCTDERVNKVTEKLFKVANTPGKMLELGEDKLKDYIFSCGLYKTKAEHIISLSKSIIDNFDGQVPSDLEKLRSLDGVGRKTANVVYSVAFHGDAIAVDTHVFRVSNRIGLGKGKTPLEVEKSLMKAIPKDKWSTMHHCLIFHGRRVCTAKSPRCGECALNSICDKGKSEVCALHK